MPGSTGVRVESYCYAKVEACMRLRKVNLLEELFKVLKSRGFELTSASTSNVQVVVGGVRNVRTCGVRVKKRDENDNVAKVVVWCRGGGEEENYMEANILFDKALEAIGDGIVECPPDIDKTLLFSDLEDE